MFADDGRIFPQDDNDDDDDFLAENDDLTKDESANMEIDNADVLAKGLGGLGGIGSIIPNPIDFISKLINPNSGQSDMLSKIINSIKSLNSFRSTCDDTNFEFDHSMD